MKARRTGDQVTRRPVDIRGGRTEEGESEERGASPFLVVSVWRMRSMPWLFYFRWMSDVRFHMYKKNGNS